MEKAGCEKIYSDTASGAKDDRKGLSEAIEFSGAGDSLVIWKLDRLGRSLKHLIETINHLHGKKVGFVSVQESIDTTTPGGEVSFSRVRRISGIRARTGQRTHRCRSRFSQSAGQTRRATEGGN